MPITTIIAPTCEKTAQPIGYILDAIYAQYERQDIIAETAYDDPITLLPTLRVKDPNVVALAGDLSTIAATVDAGRVKTTSNLSLSNLETEAGLIKTASQTLAATVDTARVKVTSNLSLSTIESTIAGGKVKIANDLSLTAIELNLTALAADIATMKNTLTGMSTVLDGVKTAAETSATVLSESAAGTTPLKVQM